MLEANLEIEFQLQKAVWRGLWQGLGRGLKSPQPVSGGHVLFLQNFFILRGSHYFTPSLDNASNLLIITSMPYTRRPFQPETPYANQVSIELNKANDNFDILARAFVSDNPETFKVKNASYSDNSDKVDGYDASLTPAPNVIPVSDASGKLGISWLYASQTSTPNYIPIANSSGKLDASWLISHFNIINIITGSYGANTVVRVPYNTLVVLSFGSFYTSASSYYIQISSNGSSWTNIVNFYFDVYYGNDYGGSDYYFYGDAVSFILPKNWYFRSNRYAPLFVRIYFE